VTVLLDDNELVLGLLLHNFYQQHCLLSSSFMEYALHIQFVVLEALYLHG
jgi:hypothetical protein